MGDSGREASFRINRAGLEAQARPTVFAIINAIATSLTAMERAYGMRPAELQVFLLIGLAGVQRVLRERPLPDGIAGMEPVPLERLSGISRRQLAELTGLSREAIRRTTLRLVERGLVVEKERGALVHTPGSFQKLNDQLPLEDLLQPFVTMMNQLERSEAISVRR